MRHTQCTPCAHTPVAPHALLSCQSWCVKIELGRRTDGRTDGDITERGAGSPSLFRGLYIKLMCWRVHLILSYCLSVMRSGTIYK